MIGWIGAALLGICALPLTIEALILKKANVQTLFLALWFFGEIAMVIHCLSVGDAPLLVNYILNTVLLLPVVAVKIKSFRRKK